VPLSGPQQVNLVREFDTILRLFAVARQDVVPLSGLIGIGLDECRPYHVRNALLKIGKAMSNSRSDAVS
jgi:hypothetical protein